MSFKEKGKIIGHVNIDGKMIASVTQEGLVRKYVSP